MRTINTDYISATIIVMYHEGNFPGPIPDSMPYAERSDVVEMEKPPEQQPLLAKLDLNQEMESKEFVPFSEDQEALNQPEKLSYHFAELRAQNFIKNNEDPGKVKEIQEGLRDLGMKDMYAKVYSREGGELGENLKDKNVYVLLHGWTGNHAIYDEVEQGNHLTVVEEIMAKDPNAVIIAMDGNGFGESKFTDDAIKDIKKYCTPEAYAKQVDFFLSEVLGYEDNEDKTGITIMGHSMGGAAAMLLSAKYGYENPVALAPALFPSRENLTDIEQKFEDPSKVGRMEKILRYAGYRHPGDFRYGFVGAAAKLGEETNKALPPVARYATETFFQFVGPGYMGENITGDPEQDAAILEKLLHIHRGELGTHTLVKHALTNLRNSVNFNEFSLKELERLHNVAVFTGADDKLVTPQDVTQLLRAMTAYELIRAAERNAAGELTEDELMPIRAQIEAIEHIDSQHDQVSSRSQTLKRIVGKGGHYSPVYGGLAVDALVQGAQTNRARRMSRHAQT